MFGEGLRILTSAGLASSLIKMRPAAVTAVRNRSRIGRGISSLGRRVGGITSRVAGFANDHPSSVIIPAAIAGGPAFIRHPLRAASTAYGNTFYDNPNAVRDMLVDGSIGGFLGPNYVNAVRGFQPGFGINVGTMTPGITNEDITNTGAYDPDNALRQAEASHSPQGSIIFGLYHNRLR